MKRIRCATVASYMGPYAANYIHSALFLDQKLRSKGGEMIHVFPEEVKNMEWLKLFEEINAKVYFVKFKPYSLHNVRAFKKIFKMEKINIIHSHFSEWDITVKIAAPHIPVVWHERMSVNVIDKKKRFKNWIKFNIIGLFNTYSIGISNEVYNQISSITRNKRCTVIPDAIKFERLNNTYKKIKNKPYKILLFGWSPIVKGVDIAYKACEILNKEETVVELNMVSQVESQQYVKEHFSPLPDWFHVLPPTDEVYRYYDETDAFLSASRSEGFSNAILEAIYCGRPVVLSNIKATRWALEFQNTYPYDVESPELLASAVRECMNSYISKESVRKNKELAIAKYSMDTWANDVLDVLLLQAHDL